MLEKDIEEMPYLEGSLRYAVNSNDSTTIRHIKIYEDFKKRLEGISKRRYHIAKELNLELKNPDSLDF